MSLVGERSSRRFSLGDELQVVLMDVTPEQGRLDLNLATGHGQKSRSPKAKSRSAGVRRRGDRRPRRRR